MAIVSMQKLSICANKRNRKAILETLQNLGNVEVFTDGIGDDELVKLDTQSARAAYERNADSFDRVLKLLDTYAPGEKKGMSLFAEKASVKKSDYEKVVGDIKTYMADQAEILGCEKEINECGGLILKNRNQIESLTPWLSLDVPMNTTGTKETAVFIGTLPQSTSQEALYAAASKDLPEPGALTAEIISDSNEMTCVCVISLKRDSAKVEENLRSIGFARPSQITEDVPEAAKADLEREIAELEKRTESLKSMIASYGDRRGEYRIAADYFRTRAEKYRLLGTIPQSESAFFMEGWVPADQADRVAQILTEKYGALVEMEATRESDEEPTALRNNRFSQAAEGVLASYGLPKHGHVDPTFIMSIFYVFFFGMMLSDAGYGIVMVIACGIALMKFPKMAEGTKKMMQLFFWCGLSTTFWGIMYGGFFGDAIDVIAKTFFGYTGDGVVKALWFEPLKDPMRLLVWCMLFGVIHLFVGLGIKGYEYLANGDIVGFISDIVSWYMFLMGLILMLVPSELFSSIAGMSFNFPSWVAPLAKGLALCGMIIIILMSGRGRKNWALRIALGAYDIYGVTSWLSDVLSYSRLLALGLATGVIGNVINMMASMFGGGVIGAILFAVIFVLGHTLNLGINALGAYVHTNRLQYVEFFGKFYEAGGRPFTPFQNANKYVEVKEER
ncbi:MAG: V-type ATP synthase subunit I [Lachnospiraceae bacterium]|nr:V-type ATP synthase subunit I [Lachnospiraceae bacterium]